MRDTNITMVRGNTLSFGIEYDGTEQDLDTAVFGIRDSDGGFLVKKTLGSGPDNGISKVGTGQYVVRVAPEDTETKNTGTYYYEFQVGINNDVFTLLQGALTLVSEEIPT